MCIVYNTRENEDQKCFFRDLSIRTLLKIKDKQGAKALVKNIILEESLEGFHKVLNQMTVGEIENFFEALLKNLGLKERGSEDPEYDQRILLYSLCSLMHFHHLKREELYELTYLVIRELMQQMIRIKHPETLPKPKKKIKGDEELLEYLKGKYGV